MNNPRQKAYKVTKNEAVTWIDNQRNLFLRESYKIATLYFCKSCHGIFLTATGRVDKTHCSYKEVPYPLLFPAQLHCRLQSHLFQGLPAITWLLYSRDHFFTFFGLSSHFSPQAIRHISLPIIPEVFCVYLTSSPCQKPLFLS